MTIEPSVWQVLYAFHIVGAIIGALLGVLIAVSDERPVRLSILWWSAIWPVTLLLMARTHNQRVAEKERDERL